MTGIEVAKQCNTEGGAMLFRPRKAEPGQYDAKPWACGNKRGWVLLDTFSASAIVAVYDALNEKNRESYGRMPLQKMAMVAFRLVK